MIARFDKVLRYRLSRPWETLLQILYLLFMSRWHTTLSRRSVYVLRPDWIPFKRFANFLYFVVGKWKIDPPFLLASLRVLFVAIHQFLLVFPSRCRRLPTLSYIAHTWAISIKLWSLVKYYYNYRLFCDHLDSFYFCVENPLARPPLFVKSRNAQRAIWYTGIPRIWLTV